MTPSRPFLYCVVRILVFITGNCIIGAIFFLSGRLQAQIPDYKAGDFARADSIAALYPNHSLVNLKSLADKLTLPLATDLEKFRSIYRWVCANIETDYDFYIKNKSKREKLNDQPEALKQWNQKSNPYFFRKLLREHKTICTGYAYLVKELAFHAGLPCKIIDGYGRTVDANFGGTGIANHSWNAVQLNHQWYLADATWSSGAIDPQQKTHIKQFEDAYFLTPPALFVLNHYPLDSAWMLLKDKPTLPDFLNGPLIYKTGIRNKVLPVFPKTFRTNTTKGEKVTFRFRKENEQLIKKVELLIIQGGTFTSVYPGVNTDSDGFSSIDYVFRQRGSYVVHLLLNDEYVFTYTVRVLK